MKKYSLITQYFICFFLLGSMMAGCATYRGAPIAPSEVLSSYNTRTLDNPDLKEFISKNLNHEITQWPPASWDFETLTFVAFYYHPDLDVVRAKWGVTQASIISAGARPNPTVGFVPTYNIDVINGLSPWTLGPTFDVPVETAGKRVYRINQSKHLSEAARLNIATAIWQIRSHLREALLDLYVAGQKETILKRQMTMQEENVQLLEGRLSQGEISSLSVNRAKILFNKTLLFLNDIQKQKKEAYVRLADSLGLPVSALEGVNLDFDIFKEMALSENLDLKMLRQYALLNRSDILSGLAEYEASQSALQLEIAKQYPDIHLGPGYSWDQGDNKWSLGVSVTLPVFNQNQGPIAEALARREEARAKFVALQLKVIAEIDEGLETYQGSIEKFKSAENLLTVERKQNQFLQATIKEGEIHRVTLLNSQIELDSTESAYLDNLAEAQKALGALERILQRPLMAQTPNVIIPEDNPQRNNGNKK